MKKHVCPHCGEAAFTPLRKAMAGSLRSSGKPCPNCGRKCCNDMSSIYFSAVTSVIMLIICVFAYLSMDNKVTSSIIIVAAIAVNFLLCFLYDMFFGKLTAPIRLMD